MYMYVCYYRKLVPYSTVNRYTSTLSRGTKAALGLQAEKNKSSRRTEQYSTKSILFMMLFSCYTASSFDFIQIMKFVEKREKKEGLESRQSGTRTLEQ